MLLFCIFLQNGSACIHFLIGVYNSEKSFSFFVKKDKNTSDEEKEENQKESKEENKEESSEKEKELKSIKDFNSFVYLPAEARVQGLFNAEDSEIFTQHLEIETPPPQG
jgi:hypothetical protein